MATVVKISVGKFLKVDGAHSRVTHETAFILSGLSKKDDIPTSQDHLHHSESSAPTRSRGSALQVYRREASMLRQNQDDSWSFIISFLSGLGPGWRFFLKLRPQPIEGSSYAWYYERAHYASQNNSENFGVRWPPFLNYLTSEKYAPAPNPQLQCKMPVNQDRKAQRLELKYKRNMHPSYANNSRYFKLNNSSFSHIHNLSRVQHQS